MPRRNRVTPFNEIVAVPERGTLMGNRGILHDAAGRILRHHTHRTWVTCRLEFRGRWRPPMPPGAYTALFFLDEATALAAGHRPCGECRRADYLRFKGLLAGLWGIDPAALRAAELDRRLHPERVRGRGAQQHKPTAAAAFGELPDGVMFHNERHGAGDPPAAWLKWQGAALRWTPGGYTERRRLPASEPVRVLTPATVVEAIRAGYRPAVHPSAEA